ncbi:MAG: hypothetical protein ACLVH8_10810 [Fusobacterium sp.]
MQAKIPVLAVTDPNTDIGKIIMEGEFGWWCESNHVNSVTLTLNHIVQKKDLHMKYGENAFKYLEKNFSTEKAYSIIMR